MTNPDANRRHRSFKNELRRYHDSINRRNRYNLSKISGKLNVFGESEEEEEKDDSKTVEIDRVIPNTNLAVLEKDGMYAIGTRDGKPLTEFKYAFIEGALGDERKKIPCISHDNSSKIDYFDVEKEVISECSAAPCGAISTTSTGAGCPSSGNGEHHEIEYEKVKKDLMIPYLSGYRIKDMRTGKLLNKGIKHRKHGKRR